MRIVPRTRARDSDPFERVLLGGSFVPLREPNRAPAVPDDPLENLEEVKLGAARLRMPRVPPVERDHSQAVGPDGAVRSFRPIAPITKYV